MKFIDLSGLKIGRLYVKQRANNIGGRVYFLCQCDCGEELFVDANSLRRGSTKSCGCLKADINKARLSKHNMKGTRIYNIWINMRQRCNNPHSPCYKYYGGRGISVCKEWETSFLSFYQWAMENGYKDNLTIDRIDVNANYTPENCRFSTRKEQARNMRSNRLYKGKPISQLCEEYGLDYGYVRRRLNFYHDPLSKFFGGLYETA